MAGKRVWLSLMMVALILVTSAAVSSAQMDKPWTMEIAERLGFIKVDKKLGDENFGTVTLDDDVTSPDDIPDGAPSPSPTTEAAPSVSPSSDAEAPGAGDVKGDF